MSAPLTLHDIAIGITTLIVVAIGWWICVDAAKIADEQRHRQEEEERKRGGR